MKKGHLSLGTINLGKDIELVEILGILAAIATLAYFGYKIFEKFAGKAGDYETGSVADTLVNNALEVGKSSESYTDAFGTVVTSPWGSLKSILGIGDNG